MKLTAGRAFYNEIARGPEPRSSPKRMVNNAVNRRNAYKHLLSLMARNRDELNETLTERQSETLEKYDSAVNEMHSLAEVEAFSYGFRLGVRLMIEAK